MADRIRFNFPAIRRLLHDPGVVGEVEHVAQRIEAHAASESSTRYDFTPGGHRPRAAVIAGYEHGATAENTRAVLLRALDGAA